MTSITESNKKIYEVEDSSFEIILSEVNKEKRMKKSEEILYELWDTIK